MDNILFSTALAFIITFFSIPVIIQVAKAKKLYDEPDERKVHKNVIPTLGGLGIFAGFSLAVLMGIPAGQNPEFQFFVAATVVIFFLGIKDDIMILSATKKFVGQLVAAGILIKFGGVQITNMHGFLGVYEIPYFAGILLSLFTIIVITNAFNLIDGVDGLAGSLGLVTTLAFGIYFTMAGQIAYGVLAFGLAGSILGFLIYNFSPAKIFMGDTGSLLIGLINAILVIKFINIAGAAGATIPIATAPAIGFAILMVPLFDTLRVFAIRIISRRSPFSPDRNHVHHFLLDLGFSHRQIALSCSAAAVSFIAIAVLLNWLNINTTAIIAILLAVSCSMTALIFKLRQKSKTSFLSNTVDKDIIKTRKIINFVPDALEAN